jgi:hypothetical protein
VSVSFEKNDLRIVSSYMYEMISVHTIKNYGLSIIIHLNKFIVTTIFGPPHKFRKHCCHL